MTSHRAQIGAKGRLHQVSSIQIDDWTVALTGKWIKVAMIRGESWLPGADQLDPERFVRLLKQSDLRPDWFTLAQKLTETKPKYALPFEWDNAAAIPITTFDEWWERRVSHDLRNDVKRAEKRGVTVRAVTFDDHLVRGIKEIYDEVPFRQGRQFWHYGKDLETIKKENSSYLDRSEFFGAFLGEELIGFIKIVYVDDLARLMQILSKDKHQDKRPANALIAKAVQVSEAKGCSYLTYGHYTYDNKRNTPLARFKRRNGFAEILFPRYYIPMSFRGKVMIRMGFHLGFRRLLPEGPMNALLNFRAKARDRAVRRGKPSGAMTELVEDGTLWRTARMRSLDK